MKNVSTLRYFRNVTKGKAERAVRVIRVQVSSLCTASLTRILVAFQECWPKFINDSLSDLRSYGPLTIRHGMVSL
jgi:hypothetical protein